MDPLDVLAVPALAVAVIAYLNATGRLGSSLTERTRAKEPKPVSREDVRIGKLEAVYREYGDRSIDDPEANEWLRRVVDDIEAQRQREPPPPNVLDVLEAARRLYEEEQLAHAASEPDEFPPEEGPSGFDEPGGEPGTSSDDAGADVDEPPDEPPYEPRAEN